MLKALHMKPALVLVNLGTPRSYGYGDMFCYLAQFLGDKRVVDLPRWQWLPLLYGIILPVRSYKSGHAYAQVWSAKRGSPLRFHTADIARKLGAVYAMRYGKPRIETTLSQLVAEGYTHIKVLPLYPQYAGATVGTTEDVIRRWQKSCASRTARCSVEIIPPYYAHPAYIAALANSVKTHLKKNPETHATVVSFHGLPQRYTTQYNDPYQQQCETTFNLLQKALPKSKLILTYQSRFGREEWLQPYTSETLARLPQQGIRHVAVIAPGFACDCVETLEELGLRGKETFMENGGKSFSLIPCLNATAAHIRLLRALL